MSYCLRKRNLGKNVKSPEKVLEFCFPISVQTLSHNNLGIGQGHMHLAEVLLSITLQSLSKTLRNFAKIKLVKVKKIKFKKFCKNKSCKI